MRGHRRIGGELTKTGVKSRVPPCGRSCMPRASIRHRGAQARAGGSSCALRLPYHHGRSPARGTVLLSRRHVLVFIEHGCILAASPRTPVAIGPCRPRNLALSFGERSGNVKFLIRDRGSDSAASFGAVFQTAGTRIVRTAVQAPPMNAICERGAGTLRREAPGRGLIPG